MIIRIVAIYAACLFLLLSWSVRAAADLLIRGATVHTQTEKGALEADVLISKGRVVALGPGLELPEHGRVIDAAGAILTPGLVSARSHLGLTEVDAVAATVDYNSAALGLTAAFDPSLAYNSRSTLAAVNRTEGITSAVLVPWATGDSGERGVLAGLVSVVDLVEGAGSLRRRGAALAADLGEYGAELAGGSRAAALQLLELALEEASDFQANERAWERRRHRDYRFSAEDLTALQPLFTGNARLLVRVDRASDIEALLQLVESYQLQAVILGGAEAWMLAPQLAQADIPVIIDAAANLPASFDKLNARIDGAALLDAAGVIIAFGGNSTIDNHNARNATQAAGIAVAHGLPWERGLAAITRNPAVIFGVDDEIGSIAPGQVANLVLWNEDPLELTSFPTLVLLRGEAVSLHNRQTLLRDRYLERRPGYPAVYALPTGRDSR